MRGVAARSTRGLQVCGVATGAAEPVARRGCAAERAYDLEHRELQVAAQAAAAAEQRDKLPWPLQTRR